MKLTLLKSIIKIKSGKRSLWVIVVCTNQKEIANAYNFFRNIWTTLFFFKLKGYYFYGKFLQGKYHKLLTILTLPSRKLLAQSQSKNSIWEMNNGQWKLFQVPQLGLYMVVLQQCVPRHWERGQSEVTEVVDI